MPKLVSPKVAEVITPKELGPIEVERKPKLDGKKALDAFGTGGADLGLEPSKGKSSTKVQGPGLVGGVSVVALQDAARSRAAEVRPFARMVEEAKQRGLEVFVLGGAASSFAAHVKAGLQLEGGDPRFRADWVQSNEISAFLNLATQDVDLVVARSDGKPETLEEIAAFQAFVDEKLAGLEIDVRGLRTAKDDIHFPLVKGSPFFQEHHNNLDLLALHLTAGAGEPALVDIGGKKAVDDLAAGTVRLMLSDEHGLTPTGKTGNSPPIKHALRALIKAVRHELTPDPASRAAMKKLFEEWGGHVDDSSVLGRWLTKNLKKLVVDAMDLRSAYKLLDEVGALPVLKKLDDPGLAKLFLRRPFVEEAPDGKPTGETAKSLGIEKLWHLTDDYEAFVAMSRTPLWRPNFLSSTGEQADGTVASYGAGVYFTLGGEAWGESSGKKSAGYVVEVKLDPAAKEGPDFKRVTSDSGQTFIVVKKRSVLTLDQVPLHKLDLDNALKMLLAPETGTRLHVLEQLQERLTVLGTDPKLKADIAKRLLAEAASCAPERIGDFVAIMGDARMRELAPEVVPKLVSRALGREDVVTALELLDGGSDEKTLRAFAEQVMPLVGENAGIFIHTFGERLFGMFAACPDALEPILLGCESPRDLLSHGLAHGDPVYLPTLKKLAKSLDSSDRQSLRSWSAEDLEKPAFAPIAKLLGA